MRKITKCLLFFFLFSFSLAHGQGSEGAKTAFALLGGVNLQNINGKDFNGNTLENDLIIGFHAGVNAQIPIAPEFFFQPGLLFSTKGAQNTTAGIKSTFNLSYLELPLNLVYKGALGNGWVMLGFGPYVGYGIQGKVKIESDVTGEMETAIEFKNEVALTDPISQPYFKAFDAGANIFAGYEMAGGIFLQLNTQFGLLKINPEDLRFPDGESSLKNTGFGVSLGYRF